MNRFPPTTLHRSWTPASGLDQLALGFATAHTPENLIACLVGVFLGTLIGVLPGLGPVTTIALLLPFTFSLTPAGAMIVA